MAFFRSEANGGKIATGIISTPSTGTTVTVGFKPKKIFLYQFPQSDSSTNDFYISNKVFYIYDEDYSTNRIIKSYSLNQTGENNSSQISAYIKDGGARITNISNTGFTIKGSGNSAYNTSVHYTAIG